MREAKLTGKHALAIFGGAFSVIIGVNILLAVKAVGTFPGLEVRNSYVASQEFNDRRAAQEALGWTARARAQGGRIRLAITDRSGAPVRPAVLEATVGRATESRSDFTPAFDFDGTSFVAPADLRPGKWDVRMRARAQDGTEFVQRLVMFVDD